MCQSIYDEETIFLYKNADDQTLAPHPFSIAKQTCKQLVEHSRDQSIVVFGETGAGKTELAKQIVKYIATVAGVERMPKVCCKI